MLIHRWVASATMPYPRRKGRSDGDGESGHHRRRHGRRADKRSARAPSQVPRSPQSPDVRKRCGRRRRRWLGVGAGRRGRRKRRAGRAVHSNGGTSRPRSGAKRRSGRRGQCIRVLHGRRLRARSGVGFAASSRASAPAPTSWPGPWRTDARITRSRARGTPSWITWARPRRPRAARSRLRTTSPAGSTSLGRSRSTRRTNAPPARTAIGLLASRLRGTGSQPSRARSSSTSKRSTSAGSCGSISGTGRGRTCSVALMGASSGRLSTFG